MRQAVPQARRGGSLSFIPATGGLVELEVAVGVAISTDAVGDGGTPHPHGPVLYPNPLTPRTAASGCASR